MVQLKKISSLLLLSSVIALVSCNQQKSLRSDIYTVQRHNMVRWDLKEQGIKSELVLQAMAKVPRHLFLPPEYQTQAYQDKELPISQYLTTPPPIVVAKTIELLNLQGFERVLEVGTGRGYQAALLSELSKEVYTIEIVPEIAKEAKEILSLLQYKNVACKLGDGYQGWPDKQPFDAIIVTASASAVPSPLLEQLKIGGRLVMPIQAGTEQSLVLYRKTTKGLEKESIMPVKLQPMEGKATGRSFQ